MHIRLLLPVIFIPALACPQSPGPPPAETPKPDDSLGTYSLIVTTLELSPTVHWLNPPVTLDLDAATPLVPKEVSGTKPVPAQYAVESLGNPRYDCMAKVEQDHGCEAIDRSDLAIRDPNTVGYHFVNHGAAVQLQLNLQVRDLVPVSRTTLDASWRPGDVIFLPVPKATPSLHVVSASIFGNWNGNAIVFEPGKPLPETAKKALEDLQVHQDLGDRVVYAYKVKDPKPAK